MPPTHVIGAATIIVQAISTSIWTCCTSLVMRVISDGAPNCADLAGREAGDLVEQVAARTSRPKPIAALAPKYTAAIAKTIWTSVTASISAPVAPDVAGVAGEHAVVDDVGVERRQVSVATVCTACRTTTSDEQRCGTAEVAPQELPEFHAGRAPDAVEEERRRSRRPASVHRRASDG